jgi:hypothetical protein
MKNTLKKEILDRVKKAKFCFVNCVIDGQDVEYYFKTSKWQADYYIRKYIRNNENLTHISQPLENLNNCVVLRDDGDLYIN